MKEKNLLSRKKFLSYTALAGAAGVLGSVSPILTSCAGGESVVKSGPLRPVESLYFPTFADKAVEGKTIKVGLVGCGGRGSGAIQNCLESSDNIVVVAIADVFSDRVENVRKELSEKGVEVAAENCFVGFDAYQKVIDSGIDIVIICTPPVFRPEQFKYAVEKGVNSFLEKPIAVDPAGYRSIVASCKQADAKGLSVVTGTQRHHNRDYNEAFKKVVAEGLIGEITGGCVYWNGGMLWYKEKEKNWTNMEWMIRDWVNWKWLSGDHIVEQHVHNIDVFMWFSNLKPVSAVGFGSRQRRVTGDQFDNFSIDFTMENGIHLHSMCRQIDGTASNVSEFIQGTKGSWSSDGQVIKDLQGNILWKYDYEQEKNNAQNNPYVLEHMDLITHVRNGQPVNNALLTAESSLAAVMGRESAYSGLETTWEEMSSSPLNYMPAEVSMSNIDMSGFKTAAPGTSNTGQ